MPTLILTPRYTDDAQALWKAAGDQGWRTKRLTQWRVPAHLRALPELVLRRASVPLSNPDLAGAGT